MNDNINSAVAKIKAQIKNVSFTRDVGFNTICAITTVKGDVIYGESCFELPDETSKEAMEAISYSKALNALRLLDD